MSALCLGACDSAGSPSPVGQWSAGSQPIAFDVPFSGRACGRQYVDARRETRGYVEFFDLTLAEEQGRLSGLALSAFEIQASLHQPGLPDCPLGGNSANGYDSVAVTVEGDLLTTGPLLFGTRGEFRVEENALVGALYVDRGSYYDEYVIGEPRSFPVTLRRGAPAD